MVSHSSSVTSSLAMPSGYPVDGFVRLTKSLAPVLWTYSPTFHTGGRVRRTPSESRT
jgi:hypothetical protein